jgi:hypothetical protein
MTTVNPTPVLRISAGRAAAALAAAKAAEGHDPAAKALAAAITKTGEAALTLDRAQAVAIAKAIVAGVDGAELPGQRRGAARAALAALIERHGLKRSDMFPAAPKPAPAAKAAPKTANAPSTAAKQ